MDVAAACKGSGWAPGGGRARDDGVPLLGGRWDAGGDLGAAGARRGSGPLSGAVHGWGPLGGVAHGLDLGALAIDKPHLHGTGPRHGAAQQIKYMKCLKTCARLQTLDELTLQAQAFGSRMLAVLICTDKAAHISVAGVHEGVI